VRRRKAFVLHWFSNK